MLNWTLDLLCMLSSRPSSWFVMFCSQWKLVAGRKCHEKVYNHPHKLKLGAYLYIKQHLQRGSTETWLKNLSVKSKISCHPNPTTSPFCQDYDVFLQVHTVWRILVIPDSTGIRSIHSSFMLLLNDKSWQSILASELNDKSWRCNLEFRLLSGTLFDFGSLQKHLLVYVSKSALDDFMHI